MLLGLVAQLGCLLPEAELKFCASFVLDFRPFLVASGVLFPSPLLVRFHLYSNAKIVPLECYKEFHPVILSAVLTVAKLATDPCQKLTSLLSHNIKIPSKVQEIKRHLNCARKYNCVLMLNFVSCCRADFPHIYSINKFCCCSMKKRLEIQFPISFVFDFRILYYTTLSVAVPCIFNINNGGKEFNQN